MNLKCLILGLALGSCSFAQADCHPSRFTASLSLKSGHTITVSEGDFEPRGIGSFALRLYGVSPNYPYDRYISGLLEKRDGCIESVSIDQLKGASNDYEVIKVVIRSIGSGGFQSIYWYYIEASQIIKLLSRNDLPQNIDLDKVFNKRQD